MSPTVVLWGRSGVITPAAQHLFLHRLPPSPRPKKTLGLLLYHPHRNHDHSSGSSSTRRSLILLLLSFLGFPHSALISPSLAASPLSTAKVDQEGEGEVHLEWYTDKIEGFTLLRPNSWLKVDKAGATVLFEDGKEKKNNIGVVVNPVRLSSLKDFGTPQFVADKLIQAERRKESTKDAELVRVSERLGLEGLPVYEFEYTVNSTRGGMKRIFSAAFVASKKLYLLNIACPDPPESHLDNQTRIVLEQILHSFDSIANTSMT